MSKAKQIANTEFRHRLPEDLRELLEKNGRLRERWDALTSLARNEWICWVTMVKKKETRKEHLRRLSEEIRNGGKRPCCFPGCPHRRPGAKKWFNGMK